MSLFNLNIKGLKIFILLLPVLGLFACKKDFLDNQAELSIPESRVFETPARILAQVNGLYSSAKIGSLFGGRYQIYNDIRSGEFRNRTSNVVTGFGVYQFTNDPSDTYIEGFWINGYLTINRVNKFLADFELAKNQGIVSDQLKSQYIAEAKFVRAYCYYALVQMFAKPYTQDAGASRGLPLRLKAQTDSADNNLKSSTVAQVYAQILKDLNEAEVALPASYSTSVLNTTRAHKNTVAAFKSRVYLAMGKFPDVITEANKIVSATAPFRAATGVNHTLNADVTKVYGNGAAELENVFSAPMSATNAPGTQNQLGYYYNAGNIEYFLNQGATGIYNNPAWPASDLRKSKFVLQYSAAWHILVKYSSVSPFTDWVPLIRYSEVLLNLAEAEAEAGSLTRAEALVKAVRQRSDPSYTMPAFTTKTIAVQNILLERRIELLGEGFNAPDIQRRLQPFVSVGAGASIPYTDSRYVFPIPTSEKLTNKIVE